MQKKSASFQSETQSELHLIRLDYNSQTYFKILYEGSKFFDITLHRNDYFLNFLLLSIMEANRKKIFIQYKCGCALNILLKRNKKVHEKNKKKGIKDPSLNYSYEKISTSTELRIATISDIFNGASEAKISTLDSILKSLGTTYRKFGGLMDSLTEEEIIEFIKRKEKPKSR